MRKVPKIVWSILACVICIVITAGASMVIANKNASSDKYLEIIKIIDNNYYTAHDLSDMEDASAAAMVASLGDSGSYYMNAREYEEFKLLMTNQYMGIGITTEYNERYGYLSVISVTPGSPADEAHIKVGNLIAMVNDINVAKYTPDDLNELIRSFEDNENEADRYFTLKLMNTQGGKAEVRMRCQLIYAEPVFYYVIEDTRIGYIKVRNFDDSAAVSLKNAFSELERMGVNSVILDLRDNESSKPAEVAEALDLILPKGDLFLLRDRTGKETTYTSGNSGIDLPIVVMVNEKTSCGAEMFACVMQQAGYTIVGRRTAANAQSQVIVELDDGSAVRISKFEYLTPDKKNMTELGGVLPDVISYQISDSEMDVQLEAAKDAAE